MTTTVKGVPIQDQVFIKTKFVGFHRWKGAPDEVAFLRNWHRHEFHVELRKEVDHANRDIEFTTLKIAVDKFIRDTWENNYFDASCEHIANELLREFEACFVSVSEDGENGGVAQIPPLYRVNVPQHSAEEAEEVRKRMREAFEKYGTQKLTLSKTHQPINPQPLEKRTKIFIGTEAEGPHRGMRTLFIPGSVGPTRLEKVFRDNPDLFIPDGLRVYFGAGGCNQVFDLGTWHIIKQAFASTQITVELEIFNKGSAFIQEVRRNGAIIVAGEVESRDLPSVTFIKRITPTHVIWIGEKKEFYLTALNDPLYSEDKELE